jgi:hypothetical protein
MRLTLHRPVLPLAAVQVAGPRPARVASPAERRDPVAMAETPDIAPSATLDRLVSEERVTPDEAAAIVREVRAPHAGGAGEVIAAVGAVIVAATVVALTEGLVESAGVAAAISAGTAVALALIGLMLRRGRTQTTRRVVSVVLSAAVVTAGIAVYQLGTAVVGEWDWSNGTDAEYDARSQRMAVVTLAALVVAAALAAVAYRLARTPVTHLVLAASLVAVGPATVEAAGLGAPAGPALCAAYLLALACGWYLAQRAGWLRERTTAHLVVSAAVVGAAIMALNTSSDITGQAVGMTLGAAGLILLAGYFTVLRSGATLAVALLVVFAAVEVLVFSVTEDPMVALLGGVVIGLAVVGVGVWLTVRGHRPRHDDQQPAEHAESAPPP